MITRTLVQRADPKLSRDWSNRHIDSIARFNWNAAIQVDPIQRDAFGNVTRPYGFTTYPDGSIARFDINK